MQALGKTSLMAYWVHVMLVYGNLAKPLRRALNTTEAAAATVAVTAAMVALSAAKLWWTGRRAQKQQQTLRQPA
jgi:outer membrane protein TolC